MKHSFFVALCVLLGGIAFFSTFASSSACEPAEGEVLSCVKREPLPARPTLTSTPELVNLPLPRGDSPSTAMQVSTNWQTLAPRASTWYKTSYSENYRVLEFWLEASRLDAVTMAVYSPDQTQGPDAFTKPIGRGTHSKSDGENVIRWRAGYARPGIWYVLVSNTTAAPVSYQLNHNQQGVESKTCVGYWEYIKGVLTYWVDCQGRQPK